MPASPLAYSYVRFSHPDQAKGDSLRRQAQAAADWCERNGVTLDTSTTLRDLGKSAYTGTHRTNPDRHALAAFLKLVEAGKVPRGSYLILENLDRLSREHIQPALLLALNLLQAGVRIVQLKPAEMVFDDKSDTMPVMMMMMELSRGHGESAIKSERVGGAWAEKKKAARETGKVITHRLPAWVEERDGKLNLIPERAAVVKRIFTLSASGYGLVSIVKRLTEEKVPAWGNSGKWFRSYLALVLKDRRATGEFQPRYRDGKPDGPPIAGYFPAAVTEEEYHAARAGAEQRRHRPGEVGQQVNIFQGLVRNARDGGNYTATRRKAGSTRRVLINANATEGRGRRWSFPFEPFEGAILSLLREVDPRDVVGKKGDGTDVVMALSGELARVEAKIAELEIELLNGSVAAMAKVLREQEAKKRDLIENLAKAKQKIAHPLSGAWGEAHSLLGVIDNAPDPYDARLRLRSALRRVVESIYLLVVPRGLVRLAAVQIYFAGDGRRDYLICHRPPHHAFGGDQEGQWWARSLAEQITEGDLDLRRSDHAQRLAAAMEQLDLAAIAGETAEE